jgi:hypothetical protein
VPSFEDNPLGALGFLLQQFSAGVAGRETPLDKIQARDREDRAFNLRAAGVALEFIRQGISDLDGLPPDQHAGYLDRIEATVEIPQVIDTLRAHSEGSIAGAKASYDFLHDNSELAAGLVGMEGYLDLSADQRDEINKMAIKGWMDTQQKVAELAATEEAEVRLAGRKAAATRDPQEALNKTAQLATSLLDNDIEPDAIASVLDALASDSPSLQAGVDAIKAALPASQADLARRRGEQDVAEAQPKIQALIDAGVDPELAPILVLGRAGAMVALAGPGELSPKEKAELRGDILQLGDSISVLERVGQQIDPDVVGIWGIISEEVGGRLQQFKPTAAISDAIGGRLGLDRETVNKAIVARNDFRLAIGQLAEFITKKGSRLSNQDREFVAAASGLLGAATTPEAAQETVNRLLRIARSQRNQRTNVLTGGDMLSGSRETVATEADIPEGATVRDLETGEIFIKRGGKLVPQEKAP